MLFGSPHGLLVGTLSLVVSQDEVGGTSGERSVLNQQLASALSVLEESDKTRGSPNERKNKTAAEIEAEGREQKVRSDF